MRKKKQSEAGPEPINKSWKPVKITKNLFLPCSVCGVKNEWMFYRLNGFGEETVVCQKDTDF